MLTDTLLTTRYIVPTRRPNQVARPRLIKALNDGLHQGHRLFLVAAAAGFGKTTLIAEWIETPGIQPAWLSLDQDCNEPRSFLSNMVASLRQVDNSFGTATQPLLAKEDRVSVQDLTAALLIDLSGAAPGRILILDDYHLISDYDIHDMVAALYPRKKYRVTQGCGGNTNGKYNGHQRSCRLKKKPFARGEGLFNMCVFSTRHPPCHLCHDSQRRIDR